MTWENVSDAISRTILIYTKKILLLINLKVS